MEESRNNWYTISYTFIQAIHFDSQRDYYLNVVPFIGYQR